MTELTTMPTVANVTSVATATCVFAVCPRGGAPALSGVTGHAEALGAVRALHVGRLTAVVQDVPAAAFSPESLRQRLSDRASLERCARAHHEVVAAVACAAPTVPLPLATLYLSEERASQAIARDAGRFLDALARVTGRAEWGVKVSVPEERMDATGDPAPGAADAAPASGRAYLDRVRSRQQARETRWQAASEAAERVHAALRSIAAAARRLPPHEAGAANGRRQVLNAAYLVDVHRARELTARLDQARRDPDIGGRVLVELTGPWAPYSFVGGSESGSGGGDDDDG
jgi:hypothetical protein